MIVANAVKEKIQSIPEGIVFTISDFDIDPQYDMAVAKILLRRVSSGNLMKVSKGKYYKPKQTLLGQIKPVTYELVKDFIEIEERMIGYMTGVQAFSAMGITSQISGSILIGTNRYRRPVKRGEYTVRFLQQNNEITEENVELLRILDAVKLIREIPSVSPDDACRSIIRLIKELDKEKQARLENLALAYTSYVRAITGAIFQYLGISAQTLRNSLNGVTSYQMPISESTLPTKSDWRIYEPARR